MILLNIMLVLFPILIYLVLSCYNLLSNQNVKKVIFIITMCSSLYLSLSLETYFHEESTLLLFCNIPALICYFKREEKLGIFFSFIIIVISYYKYDANIYVVSLKYLSYFLAYVALYKNRNFNYLFLKIMAVIQGFFMSFEYFYITNDNVNQIFKIILYTSAIYGITFISLYLFRLADNITFLYQTMDEINKDKQIKDSLFKLTHEVKNPIAVCKGYLSMMNLDNREKTEKYLFIIKTEIDRCLNIMGEYMEYSKVKIEKETFDLSMLMDDIYESFKVLITNKKIKFRYKNEGDEILVNGDYNRLKQVFVNIIKNSVESISTSGIIEIDVTKNKRRAQIIVKDNGIGMTKDELKSIKEMFFTTKKNGTGLGVSLSNEIIEAHQGKLNYKSEKNKGTTCIVTLPV